MNAVEQTLVNWKDSLLPQFEVGGLYSRNPTAHKWKAPFRSLTLREAVFWRLHDLFAQSYALHLRDHILGARILLRSGLETVSTLIFLNQATGLRAASRGVSHAERQAPEVAISAAQQN